MYINNTVKFFILCLAVLNCSSAKNDITEPQEAPQETKISYRDEMRSFIGHISVHAKSRNPNFVIIPQNGIELVTSNGLPSGTVAMDYLNSIDANGQESLFYGDKNDNVKTSDSRIAYLLNLLNISKNAGNTILVTDYCEKDTKVDNAINLNAQNGFLPFSADDRNLTTIPTYPEKPFLANADDINTLKAAKNHIFLLNYAKFESKEELFESLSQTDYDVLIIDAFFNDGTPFSKEEVNRLKVKSNGAARMVVSYMSIGEAEDYRYYWDLNWEFEQPEWMDQENSRWKGNYKVKYWHKAWQDLIVNSQNSYLNIILDAGFDGVYMDIVDAFEHFE